MVETQESNSKSSKQEKAVLAKIEPVKIEASSPDIKSPDTEDVSLDVKIELEKLACIPEPFQSNSLPNGFG